MSSTKTEIQNRADAILAVLDPTKKMESLAALKIASMLFALQANPSNGSPSGDREALQESLSVA